MSVIQQKLVPVDYDGNGTADLGFFRELPPLSNGTITGQLAAWLSAPGTGLPDAQAILNGIFFYANGDFSILGDGWVPGFSFLYPASVFTADFNGDAKTDQVFGSLVFTDPLNVFTFSGFELGTWFMDGVDVTQRQPILAPNGVDSAVVAPEWANPAFYIDVSTGKSLIGGRGPLADFNGDGTSDVLFIQNSALSFPTFSLPSPLPSPNTTQIGLWLIQNGTAVTQKVIGTTNLDWFLFNTNDFDGNGTDDLLFRNVNPNDGSTQFGVWTLDTNGNVSQQKGLASIVPVGWFVVDTNDFDGNGTADLLLAQPGLSGSPTQIGVWALDNNADILTQRALTPLASGWEIIDHNDFNSDGIADLLIKAENDGAADDYAIWLLNGSGGFLGQAIVDSISDASGFEFVASADTNGDGAADLIFVSQATTEIATWLISGTTPIAQTIIGTYDSNPSSGWNPPFIQPSVPFPPTATPPLS